MNKLSKLFSVMTVLLLVATACGNDDSKQPAEVTGTPTATVTEAPTATPTETPTASPTEAPTATPTEAPTAAPTEAPTATPTEFPTQTPDEALLSAVEEDYYAHVDDAIAYLTTLLNADYDYQKRYYEKPDKEGLHRIDYFNKEDILIKKEFYYKDGSTYTEFFDKIIDNRGADRIRDYGSNGILDGYECVGFANNSSEYTIYYTDYVYDHERKLTEQTTYIYCLNYDIDNGFQVIPFSQDLYDRLPGSEVVYHYNYTYEQDSNNNIHRTDADGSFLVLLFSYEDKCVLDYYDFSEDLTRSEPTFVFAPNGKLLYVSVVDISNPDYTHQYHTEDWEYDEHWNLISLSGFGNEFWNEYWEYDDNGRLLLHSTGQSIEEITESFTYDENGLLTSSTYEDSESDYSYLFRQYEYYGAEGNSFGLFAGKPCLCTTPHYDFDESLREWVPDGSVEYDYYEYVTFSQTINDDVE